MTNVLVMGGAYYDLIFNLERDIFNERDEVIMAENFTLHPGGKALNIASVIKRLFEDLQVSLLSVVGDSSDPLSSSLKDYISHVGIETQYIQSKMNMPTPVVGVITTNLPTPHAIVLPFEQTTRSFNRSDLDRLNLKSYDFVIGTCEIDIDIVLSAFAHLKSLNPRIHTFLNVAPAEHLQGRFDKINFKSVDYIFANLREAGILMDWGRVPEISDCHDIINEMHQSTKIPNICITMGIHGGMILKANKICEFPAFSVKVRSAVGAGDAFIAAFVGKLANNGNSHMENLKYASAVAAAACLDDAAVGPNLDSSVIQDILYKNSHNWDNSFHCSD